MSKISLIMKVSSNCNLACGYCRYLPGSWERNPKSIMENEVLRKSITELMAISNKRAEFIWHGGERLLAGQDFFNEAIEIQKRNYRSGQRVINCVQTNATLLNEDWITFFKRKKFQISISLDGPQDIHDCYRVFSSNNKGSFKKVMTAVKLLRSNNVDFGVLSVLTKESINKPNEIYDFFISNGFNRFDFLPCVELERNTGHLIEPSITTSKFTKFMIKIFDCWLSNDDPNIHIRYFENVLQGILGGKTSLCKFAGTCSNYLTIEPNGDVYPCDNYIGDGGLKIGNILYDDLDTILKGDNYAKFLKNVTTVRTECKCCRWYLVCNGGCPHYSYLWNRNFSETNYFCKARQKIFKHIESRIKKVIRS